jgi:hypothetical protein
VSFVQINPENYQSRPPLPEDVPLAHTDSSVHLTSFVLHLGSIGLLDPRLIAVVSCLQVLRLVRWHRTSLTGRRTNRPSIREGPENGGQPPLVALIGLFELLLF